MRASQVLKNAWSYYKNRKSKIGIVTDFLFLVLVVVVLVPPLRFGTMVWLTRIALSQPLEYDKVEYIEHPLSAKTGEGRDTTIMEHHVKPTVYAFGGTWSAQSCAELRSLNKMATKYNGQIEVLFITDEEPETVNRYFQRHKYMIKPIYCRIEEECEEPSSIETMLRSVPSAILVNTEDRIIIKSFGAAKWTGGKIEEILDRTLNGKNKTTTQNSNHEIKIKFAQNQ